MKKKITLIQGISDFTCQFNKNWMVFRSSIRTNRDYLLEVVSLKNAAIDRHSFSFHEINTPVKVKQ